MRSVKGCFVFSQSHRENYKHPQGDVKVAVNILKVRLPTAPVTVSDMAFILDLCAQADHNPDYYDKIAAEWVQRKDTDSDSSLAFVESADLVEIEQNLSSSSFLHRRRIPQSRTTALLGMHAQLGTNPDHPFLGVHLETGTIMSSMMLRGQCAAYCEEFGVRSSLIPGNGASVQGIRGRRTSIGTALIRIPFCNLNLAIDVDFLVIPDNLPSILCMKDMVDNRLDIRIQNHTDGFRDLTHALKMANCFLIPAWSPVDMPYTK